MPGHRGRTSQRHQHTAPLRYFQEVARTGSIREASLGLNVAPSAISRQIAKMEGETGEILFERSAKGMHLTRAGIAYQSYANSVLTAVRQMHSVLDDINGLKTGDVRIVSIEGLIPMVARAISDFRLRYPQIIFHVETVSATDVIRKLATGAAEIGLAFNASPQIGIEYLSQVIDPIEAFMAPGLADRYPPSLTLREALAAPHAIPVVGFGIRRLVDLACLTERSPLSPTLETNSIEAIKSFARNADGVSFLHRMAAERELAEGMLVSRPLDCPVLHTGTVDVCASSELLPSVSAREFGAYLCRRLAGAHERTPDLA